MLEEIDSSWYYVDRRLCGNCSVKKDCSFYDEAKRNNMRIACSSINFEDQGFVERRKTESPEEWKKIVEEIDKECEEFKVRVLDRI